MKHIKVTGCHDCDYYSYLVLGASFCRKDVKLETEKYELSKTIHPDCPLDDYEEQEWISVEDRLPDVTELVLIYSLIRGRDIAFLGIGKDSWWTNTGKSFQYEEYKKVTHWQLLPAKPDVQEGAE